MFFFHIIAPLSFPKTFSCFSRLRKWKCGAETTIFFWGRVKIIALFFRGTGKLAVFLPPPLHIQWYTFLPHRVLVFLPFNFCVIFQCIVSMICQRSRVLPSPSHQPTANRPSLCHYYLTTTKEDCDGGRIGPQKIMRERLEMLYGLVGVTVLSLLGLFFISDLRVGLHATDADRQRSDLPSSTASPSMPNSLTDKRSRRDLVNGVILFLHGSKWHKYFVQHALPRLERNFLLCFPYPVHIFYESLAAREMQQIRALVPSASAVNFEDVSGYWKRLPHNITEQTLSAWMAAGVQPKFQGRGYRLMCRFWAGIVWELPSLDKYEYYWRLDTDSILPLPLHVDPFRILTQRHCEYAYNRLKGENPYVVTELYSTFLRWASSEPNLTPEALRKARMFLEDAHGKYVAPMYYNNFELGTMRHKRHALYRNLFRYLDEQPPHGILRYRWGDAPIHTLAVAVLLPKSAVCNISKAEVPYRHAALAPGPTSDASCADVLGTV